MIADRGLRNPSWPKHHFNYTWTCAIFSSARISFF